MPAGVLVTLPLPVPARATVRVYVVGGAVAWTVSVAAGFAKVYSVARLLEKIPIFTVWVPSASEAGTAQVQDSERRSPAPKLWRVVNFCRTRAPLGL